MSVVTFDPYVRHMQTIDCDFAVPHTVYHPSPCQIIGVCAWLP